jgi:opacity protein-like surface antigen
MKKIILTLGLVFAFGLTNAQETKFGIKGGLNNTNWTGDFDTDAKTSFYLGGLVDITVSEKFHVQPELLYSSEGASDDLGVSYLRLPIMAKFYVADGFSLQAGPELAFKIGAEEDAVDDSIKSLDYGLGVGAGYELTSGLFFDLRYNLGLANISEDDNFDIKNMGLQFGLGYRF